MCHAHLPGITLASGSDQTFATGVLESLSFGEWRALDGVLTDEERNYERSAPVFYLQEIDAGAVPGEEALAEAIAAIGPIRQRVQSAIAVATGARLVDPSFSVTYYDLWPDCATPSRTVGPFERQAIVFGHRHDRTTLTGIEVKQADMVHERLLRRPPSSFPVLWWALGALEQTSRPEFSALYRLVYSVNAIETLLVPETDAKKRRFADRTAALVAGQADVDGTRQHASWLYEVRSDALHGRDYRKALDKVGATDDTLSADARALLAAVIGQVLVRLDASPEPDDEAWAWVLGALE